MRGMVYVAPQGLTTAAGLSGWLGRGRTYAGTLPAKGVKTKARRRQP